MERAEILVQGNVQGVGFRYFVMREAEKRGIVGWTKNLSTGEVLTIAEGANDDLHELWTALQHGPSSAIVEKHSIVWSAATGDFQRFSILG